MTPAQAADNVFNEMRRRLIKRGNCQTAIDELNRAHNIFRIQWAQQEANNDDDTQSA